MPLIQYGNVHFIYTISSGNVEANRQYIDVMSSFREGRKTKGKLTCLKYYKTKYCQV